MVSDPKGNVNCFYCQPGFSQPLSGQSRCISCAPGKYSFKGQRTCATIPVNNEPVVSTVMYSYCSYIVSYGLCPVAGGICTGTLVGDSNKGTTQCTATAAGSIAKTCTGKDKRNPSPTFNELITPIPNPDPNFNPNSNPNPSLNLTQTDTAFGGSCLSVTCDPGIAVVPALPTGGATAYRPCPAGKTSDGMSACQEF